jgi:hypothetical protein
VFVAELMDSDEGVRWLQKLPLQHAGLLVRGHQILELKKAHTCLRIEGDKKKARAKRLLGQKRYYHHWNE